MTLAKSFWGSIDLANWLMSLAKMDADHGLADWLILHHSLKSNL